MCRTALLCLAALAAVPSSVAAQTSKERPFIQAAKVETGPRIDGVLDDAAWQTATPVESFTQQEPNLGQPATERTEVRIVYDARTIYIAVHAYQPGGVAAAGTRSGRRPARRAPRRRGRAVPWWPPRCAAIPTACSTKTTSR